MSVTASKHSRKTDVSTVTVKVVEHADGVTICAMYPTPQKARRDNECAPGGGSMSNEDNDVTVDFTVRVPSNTMLALRTVNGGIEAKGLGADIDATTVNGSIDVSTRGFATAKTVNGSIHAAMGSTGEALEFSTVNGSIQLDVPADFAADVSFSALNGEIESDFPMTVAGSINRSKVRGRIGAGGRTLTASTVNGDLILRRTR